MDVLSTFRIRYVVEAREETHALDETVMCESDSEFKEFSQKHLGTQIIDSREIELLDYLELFDRDNEYLAKWTDKQKLKHINVVKYEKDSGNGE